MKLSLSELFINFSKFSPFHSHIFHLLLFLLKILHLLLKTGEKLFPFSIAQRKLLCKVHSSENNFE